MNHKYRKTVIAANWKMNKTPTETRAFGAEFRRILPRGRWCEIVLCMPAICIPAGVKAMRDTRVNIGAENMYYETFGAYTGEISAPMLVDAGVKYVILGHSERRGYYHETYEMLKTKVDLALENGLKVIFCCGESLEERENGSFKDVIGAEIRDSLFHLTAEQMANIVIAYEPIWAIGTGKTATSDQAQEIHALIRGLLADQFGAQVADDTTILYGGSCKPSNAPELFAKPDIDGGLIGGASLKAGDFMGIVTAF